MSCFAIAREVTSHGRYNDINGHRPLRSVSQDLTAAAERRLYRLGVSDRGSLVSSSIVIQLRQEAAEQSEAES
jgi:hypothetical protein